MIQIDGAGRFQAGTKLEGAPDQCNRFVVALPRMIRVGKKLGQTDVGAPREGLQSALGPRQRLVRALRAEAELSDRQVMVGG